MSFDRLGLSENTLKAVEESGYSEPTPIQSQAIPQVLMGRDVLGIAQTGTGKTASFTLPLIDILSEGRARARMPRTLILEPTRELAAQVSDSFVKYGKNAKLSKALLIGGVNFTDQDKALDRGVDVLIATPGRLLDHMERGKLLLNGIDILIIDEADRMLDMGFIPDVEKICSKITKKHQTLFFSATMPPPIERLVAKFLNDPKTIEVARPSSAAQTITQSLIKVPPRQKRKILRELLDREEIKNGIIFCNRKRDVKDVYQSLVRHGYSVGQLHGDMPQSERLVTLDSFKAGKVQLLTASDVAARGLDIAAVSHVFNFDIPSHAEDYIHRIGRTGRAGREGRAITLLGSAKEDSKYLAAIEELTGQAIPREEFAAAASETPAEEKRTEDRQATERPKRNRRGSRDQKKGRSHRTEGFASDDWPKEPVIGMGPHTPAFLAQPVRLK